MARVEQNFEVIVEGTYFSGAKNNKLAIKYAPETFYLPTLEAHLHVVRRKLIEERLRRKYENFAGVQICRVVSTKAVKAQPTVPLEEVPIVEMNAKQLEKFATMENLPVDIHNFGSIVDARKAVSDSFDDKKLLAKQKLEAKAEAKRKAEEQEALTGTDPQPESQPEENENLDDLG